MNVFTPQPFLRDFASAIHHLDDGGREFSRGYGNAVASAQAFAPLGTAAPTLAPAWSRKVPSRAPRRDAPTSALASTPARRATRELCTGGACG